MPALRDQVDAALAAAKRTGWDGLLAGQREYLDDVWGRADVEIDGDPRAAAGGAVRALPGRPGRRPGRAAGDPGQGADRPRLRRAHVLGHGHLHAAGADLHRCPDAARDALRWRHATLALAQAPGPRAAAGRARRSRGGRFAARSARATGRRARRRSTSTPTSPTRCAATSPRPTTPTSSADAGLDLLVETARLWRSLGHHDAEGCFRIDGVTGPDEYTALVDNNVFTNLMAARNLRAAADAADRHPAASGRAGRRRRRDRRLARALPTTIVVPFDDELGVTAQSEGFTRYRRWDFAATSAEEYPLLLHYPYYLLYSSQVVKQADLVFALYLCGDRFDARTEAARLRSTTSRSPCATRRCRRRIQAIVAAEVGHLDLAYDYFRETALIDLRD